MIKISKNPNDVVPNIRESYYDTKVVVVILLPRDPETTKINPNSYAAMLSKYHNNQYCWWGGSFAKGGIRLYYIPECNYFGDEATKISLIEYIMKTWDYYVDDYHISYYVLENQNEIIDLTEKLNITNDVLIAAMRQRGCNIWQGRS